MSDIENRTYDCYSCGNTGVLQKIAAFDNSVYEYHQNEAGIVIGQSLVENTEWYLFRCPVCGNPVLVSVYGCSGMPEEFEEVSVEYPKIDICYEGVPTNIKNAFESAVKTKGIDKAICLLSLRRTLEMICKDKNAVGRDLETKINNLIEAKVLPGMMTDAYWIVRQNGNDAAHADDVHFTEYEVQEAIKYVAIIIDYLYSLPVRMSKLKRRIEKRKATRKE